MMYGLWCMAIGALLSCRLPTGGCIKFSYWDFSYWEWASRFFNPRQTPTSLSWPHRERGETNEHRGTGNKLAGVIANLIFAAVVIRESDRELMQQIEAGVYTGADLDAALSTLIQGVMTPTLF